VKKTYDPAKKEDRERLDFLKKGIFLNYQQQWIVDNMPVTWCYDAWGGDRYCATGFPIGCYVTQKGVAKDTCVINPGFKQPDTYYVFNHVELTITYHNAPKDKVVWGDKFLPESTGRIVKVNVDPKSYKNVAACYAKKDFDEPMAISGSKDSKEKVDIPYTFSVKWGEDQNVKWSSRWDYILYSMPHSNNQCISIMISVVMVLFLSGIVARILLQALHNQMDAEHAQEKFRWKLVQEDVFRPPKKGMLLSVLVGNGTQLTITMAGTLIFASLGFLSPANRGSLMTCVIVLYVCLGTPAGYMSARIYKMFGGEKWISNVLLTTFLCPGLVFGVFLIMNLILMAKQSSAAIPFDYLVVLLALWFGVSVPLTFVGAYFGFKKRTIEHPEWTYQIPREIPEQSIYTFPLPRIIMVGALPASLPSIIVQLSFIFDSIWSHQTYYMFGFLFFVFIILIVTCSEATILFSYFQLCEEDYHWWWRAFLTSGFTAVYFFLYCIHYFFTKLAIEDTVSTILYFGYTLLLAFIFFIFIGTVGFLSTFWFVSKIYGVVEVEAIYSIRLPGTSTKNSRVITGEAFPLPYDAK
jgi:transmembrane 9 superfamily protein 2/4